ncbi:MAG: ferritin-like domain-containing protein [Oscillospiraceae bacterium]
MEKMEHMDPQRCDRIWQRVSPELDPYPEVRAACREIRSKAETEEAAKRENAAAVPAAPEIPAVPMEPAESGCCLAGRAMGSIRLIQDFIEDELADRRAYLAYAACAPNVAARRLLRQLAGEEGSHARRLMGVYYLVTGCCYQPRLQGGRVERLPWREVLRTRYHAETCGGLRYAQAAEATEDVCLREIWEELSAAEYRHARQLLSLLEQMVLA